MVLCRLVLQSLEFLLIYNNLLSSCVYLCCEKWLWAYFIKLFKLKGWYGTQKHVMHK